VNRGDYTKIGVWATGAICYLLGTSFYFQPSQPIQPNSQPDSNKKHCKAMKVVWIGTETFKKHTKTLPQLRNKRKNPMTAQSHPVTHQDLIASHRERYRVNAQAALEGLKEFRQTDDCGTCWVKVDHHFIDATDRKMPPHLDRITLCDRLARGEHVPELDCVMSAYVVRLTGKPA
jgi:hypothetical protein